MFEGVLDDTNVDEAADEEEEDGEVVRAPEEGHAFVVEVHTLFFFGPGFKLESNSFKTITVTMVISNNIFRSHGYKNVMMGVPNSSVKLI